MHSGKEAARWNSFLVNLHFGMTVYSQFEAFSCNYRLGRYSSPYNFLGQGSFPFSRFVLLLQAGVPLG